MRSRIIAIGDIHGHSAALKSILDLASPRQEDTVVFLGDYIDRGPDSRGVIEQVIDLADHCQVVSLLGNHEEMFLDALADGRYLRTWLENGGEAALKSYGTDHDISKIPGGHIDFLSNLRRFYDTDSHFFIHANYAPNWPLEQHDSNTALWLPLVEIPGPHYSGKIAVVGHTPQSNGEILDCGHLICIDTGCGFGGFLTALDVTDGQIWQVDEQGRART